MTNPKVDILLPYWGNFKLLKKAVESVQAQTETDWKMLIVDDCYPSDEARLYFTDFPDKRITYFRHEKNMGLVKNFNFVLGQAAAEYCVIFGCDDIMLPNYLESALNKIGNADYYQPGVNVIDENDNIYLPITDRVKRFLRPNDEGIHRGEKTVASLCHGNWLYFPSIFWRTTTLKHHGFDENRPNTQDVTTEINIIKDGGSMYLDNSVTFHYRRSASSFSSKAKGGTRFIEEESTYNQYADEFRKMGWPSASRAARMHITSRLNRLMSK